MLLSVVLLVVGALFGTAMFWLIRRSGRAVWLPMKRRAQIWRVIVVPIMDRALPIDALSLAARLSGYKRSRVAVLAVVEVPRTMNIDVEAPPGLEGALKRLEAAEQLVRELGAQVHGELVRVREVSDLVGRACAEMGAEAVVLESNPASRRETELLHALLDVKGPNRFTVVVAPSDSKRGDTGRP